MEWDICQQNIGLLCEVLIYFSLLQIPRPAAATSLLAVIAIVSLYAGDVMEIQTALTALMKKGAWLSNHPSQVAQKKCSVVQMEFASKVTGAVMEKMIVLMALMSKDAVSLLWILKHSSGTWSAPLKCENGKRNLHVLSVTLELSCFIQILGEKCKYFVAQF